MRRTPIIAVVVMAAFVAAASPPSKAPIEREIGKLVSLFSDGFATSYPQYWHIEFGNIFGNDQGDAVAMFSIEGFGGGNDDHQYLAAFQSVEPDDPGIKLHPFRLVAVAQIGGRTWREFDWQKMRVGINSITVSGKMYGPKDAACCPTVPIQVTFHVKDGCISESR